MYNKQIKSDKIKLSKSLYECKLARDWKLLNCKTAYTRGWKIHS